MDKKIVLNYKASNIAKAERAEKENFLQCLANLGKSMSIADLQFLVHAGGGTDDDFDKLFASGMEEVMIAIVDGVSHAGFLGNETIDTEALRKQMHEVMKQATDEAKTSLNSGKETNPQPSK